MAVTIFSGESRVNKKKFISELVTAIINMGVIITSASFIGGMISLQFSEGNAGLGMLLGVSAILMGCYIKCWEDKDGK